MHGETTAANPADEAATRRVVQNMQDGQNTINGGLLASAFAEEHDCITIKAQRPTTPSPLLSP